MRIDWQLVDPELVIEHFTLLLIVLRLVILNDGFQTLEALKHVAVLVEAHRQCQLQIDCVVIFEKVLFTLLTLLHFSLPHEIPIRELVPKTALLSHHLIKVVIIIPIYLYRQLPSLRLVSVVLLALHLDQRAVF